MEVINLPTANLDRKTEKALQALEAEEKFEEYREMTGGWYDLDTYGINKENLRVLLRDFRQAKANERIDLAKRVANDGQYWL